MAYKHYLTVALDVRDDVDLQELYEAGCPFVRHVPERFELDRDAVVQAIKEGRQDALPTGVTFTVSGGYIVKPTSSRVPE